MAFALGGAGTDSDQAHYLSPREMALSPDGLWLYVMCEASDEIRVVDTRSSVCEDRRGGARAPGYSLSTDGKKLYVANSWDDTISEVDTRSLKVERTLGTGFEPNGVQSIMRARRCTLPTA